MAKGNIVIQMGQKPTTVRYRPAAVIHAGSRVASSSGNFYHSEADPYKLALQQFRKIFKNTKLSVEKKLIELMQQKQYTEFWKLFREYVPVSRPM